MRVRGRGGALLIYIDGTGAQGKVYNVNEECVWGVKALRPVAALYNEGSRSAGPQDFMMETLHVCLATAAGDTKLYLERKTEPPA